MANANEWAPDADQTLVRAMVELLKGTSSTSMTLASSGTFTFLTQPYLYFDEGQWIILVDNANSDNWMAGQVTSYNPITGSTVFESKVSHGSGTIADWLVYLTGAWLDNPWNGGTVTNPVQINSPLGVTGVSTLARVNTTAPITSTAGDVNLNATVTLSDTDQILTAAQLFGGTIVIAPTAARILTLPTAADIIAYMSGYVVGSKFEFTVVNDSLYTVTIAPGTGVVQLGKTLIQDGAATFKVTVDSPTVVSVINESTSTLAARTDAIDSASVTSSAVDITLTNVSPGLYAITMTAEGNYVILPNATGLRISSPTFVLNNKGYYAFGIKDANGNVLGVVEGGGSATLSLASNSTVAGTWTVSGMNLSSSLIAARTILPDTFSVASIFYVNAAVSDDVSVHFARLVAGGFSVFLVNNATKTIGTPITVTSTANSVPKACFRIDETRLMLFYSNVSDKLYGSVLIIVDPIVVVGAPSSTGTITDIALEDGKAEPKIAQLDSELFVISYATADGAGVTAVMGCQIDSITSVNFGSAANINTAADNQLASTLTYALTTTTALVLYKVSGAPILNKAAVVSVTNANPPVCTVGTPVSLHNSTTKKAVSAALLTPTLAILVDDNNTSGNASAISVTIAGTVITAGTVVDMDTGIGALIDYKVGPANRFNPHVARLSDTTFLFWCRDSTGASRVMAGSVAAGVVTAGRKVTGSFSSALDGSSGAGNMLAIGNGTSEFVGVILTRDSTADTNRRFVVVAHQVTGIDITIGKSMVLDSLLPEISYPAASVRSSKTESGIYAVYATSPLALGGDVGIELFKTDGINIISKGMVVEYSTGNRLASTELTPNSYIPVGDRFIILGPVFGIEAPASAAQLSISNVVLVP